VLANNYGFVHQFPKSITTIINNKVLLKQTIVTCHGVKIYPKQTDSPRDDVSKHNKTGSTQIAHDFHLKKMPGEPGETGSNDYGVLHSITALRDLVVAMVPPPAGISQFQRRTLPGNVFI